MNIRHHHLRPREAAGVAGYANRGYAFGDLGRSKIKRNVAGEKSHLNPLALHACLHAFGPGRACVLLSPGPRCLCLLPSITEAKCTGVLEVKLCATLAGRKVNDRAPEQSGSSRDVVHPPCAHACLRKALACGCRELVRLLAQLAAVADGLLEVIAGDRVVARAVAVDPGDGAFVQVGAVGFRQAAVGGIAEEDVVEGVAVVTGVGGRGGVDESGAREREQLRCDLTVGERGDCAERELAADDGRALEDRPLRRVEPA